ncbi:unnamed protein product [Mucor hiemalis]
MGATQSKTTQPVIFYNQSSPLQFAQQEEPIKNEKKPVASVESNEKIDQLVRERVAEELKRAQQQQEQANKRAYGDLAKQNIQNDHNSVALGEDIGSMIQNCKDPHLLISPLKLLHARKHLLFVTRTINLDPLIVGKKSRSLRMLFQVNKESLSLLINDKLRYFTNKIKNDSKNCRLHLFSTLCSVMLQHSNYIECY